MTYRMRGLLDDASDTVTSLSVAAVSVADDVHEMRISVDRWLKIIGGVLIGMSVVFISYKVFEGSRRRR